MVDTTDFGLKRKPFGTLPTDESVQHWAGMADTKRKLGDIVVSVRPDDIGEREFVILYGAFGGGKTHALSYFKRKINTEADSYAFFVSKSRTSAKPTFLEVYRNIISEHLGELLPHLVQRLSQAIEAEIQRVQGTSSAPIDKQAVIRNVVPLHHHSLVSKLLDKELFQAESESIARWLTSGEVAGDDYSATSMLASLIGVMTSPIGDQPAPYQAAYLFLDEMEGILSSKPADSDAFFNAFRELINRTAAYHCAIILAFTTEAVAILEGEIPAYLQDRLTRPYLEMKELSPEDAKQFIKDYLISVRVGDDAPQNPYAPFSEEAIEFLLERPDIIPRKILMSMGQVFERATRRGKVNPGEEISRQMAEEILSEMFD